METIVIHPQNAPIYDVKYRKEESEVKALIELIKGEGVAEVTVKHEHEEEWNNGTLVRRHIKQPEGGNHQGGCSLGTTKFLQRQLGTLQGLHRASGEMGSAQLGEDFCFYCK